MDELLKRLEKTVEDFNIEVSGLIGKLKSGKIFDEDEPEVKAATPEQTGDEPEDLGLGEEKSFEAQEDEDSDIIARMRKRITHD